MVNVDLKKLRKKISFYTKYLKRWAQIIEIKRSLGQQGDTLSIVKTDIFLEDIIPFLLNQQLTRNPNTKIKRQKAFFSKT